MDFRRRGRRCWLFLPACALAGCFQLELLDVAGHPVRHPVLVAEAPYLRLAAESSSAGWRIVTELLTTTPDAQPVLHAAGAHYFATAIAHDGPICVMTTRPLLYDDRARMPEALRPVPPDVAFAQCVDSTYIVRAEFHPKTRIAAGDSVFISDGVSVRAGLFIRVPQ